MKRISEKPSLRLKLTGGLTSFPDTAAVKADMLQTSSRMRPHRGAIRRDQGYSAYGAGTVTNAGSGNVLALHRSADTPVLVTLCGNDFYYDSAGNGSAWTERDTLDADITETNRRFAAAGRGGVTFFCNGVDRMFRWHGGTSLPVLSPDLPSPDDTILNWSILPGGIQIDDFETLNWAGYDCVVARAQGIASPTPPVVSGPVYSGTYSLKVDSTGHTTDPIATAACTLAAPLDLSGSDFLVLRIFSSRSSETGGDWLYFGISEDGVSFINSPIQLKEYQVNTWVLVCIDLSAIPKTSRDAIQYLQFRMMTDGSTALGAYTFYADKLSHCGGLYGGYTYGVTFYNSQTGEESPLGCFRSMETVDPDLDALVAPKRTALIVANAIRLPTDCAGNLLADRLRLYRTLSGGSDYYKIAEITPTGGTTSPGTWEYNDSKADDVLSEADRLKSWPGQAPRPQWIVGQGDRAYLIGGTVVSNRNDVLNGAAANGCGVASAIFSLSRLHLGEVYGVELACSSHVGAQALKVVLERSVKGAGSYTEVAVSGAFTQASTGWQRATFTWTGDRDLSDKYDWRLRGEAADGTDSAVDCGPYILPSWQASGTYLAYRILLKVPNTVFVSNLMYGDMVPPIDQADAPSDDTIGGYVVVNNQDGQEIKAVARHGSDLVLFKNYCAYVMSGYTMDELGYTLVLPTYGCWGDRLAIEGDGFLFWMAQDKQVYVWQVGSVKAPAMLSGPIRETLDALTAANLAGAHVQFFDRRLFLFLPTIQRTYVYDLESKAWYASYASLDIWDTVIHTPAGENETLFALVYNALGVAGTFKVVKLLSGTSDGGSNITGEIRTPDYNLGDPQGTKRLLAFRVLVDNNTAGSTLSIVPYTNRSTAGTTIQKTLASTGLQWVEHLCPGNIQGTEIGLLFQHTGATAFAIHELDMWLQRMR